MRSVLTGLAKPFRLFGLLAGEATPKENLGKTKFCQFRHRFLPKQ